MEKPTKILRNLKQKLVEGRVHSLVVKMPTLGANVSHATGKFEN